MSDDESLQKENDHMSDDYDYNDDYDDDDEGGNIHWYPDRWTRFVVIWMLNSFNKSFNNLNLYLSWHSLFVFIIYLHSLRFIFDYLFIHSFSSNDAVCQLSQPYLNSTKWSSQDKWGLYRARAWMAISIVAWPWVSRAQVS